MIKYLVALALTLAFAAGYYYADLKATTKAQALQLEVGAHLLEVYSSSVVVADELTAQKPARDTKIREILVYVDKECVVTPEYATQLNMAREALLK
jgi:hypothetical protein